MAANPISPEVKLKNFCSGAEIKKDDEVVSLPLQKLTMEFR